MRRARGAYRRTESPGPPLFSDPSHRIVFQYTPKYTSWMNQVEIWLSILAQKLIQRGSFRSVNDLGQKVLDFIVYYNRTMAKPFKWTYQGKVLVA